MHLPWLFLLFLLLLVSCPLSQQLDPAAPSEEAVPLRPQPDEQQRAAIASVVSEIQTYGCRTSADFPERLKSLPATDLRELVNVLQEIKRRRDYLSKSCLANFISIRPEPLYQIFEHALELNAVSTFKFLTFVLPEMTDLRQTAAALSSIRGSLENYAAFHRWLNEELQERGYSEEQCLIIARRAVKLPPFITVWAFRPLEEGHNLRGSEDGRKKRALQLKDVIFKTLLRANDDTCCIEDLAKLQCFREHISKALEAARDKALRKSEDLRQLVNQVFPQARLPPQLETDSLPPARELQFQDYVKESWFTYQLHGLREDYAGWLFHLTEECLTAEKQYNTWICNVKTAIRDSRSLIPSFGSHREFKTVERLIANAKAKWTEEIIPYRIEAEHNESWGLPEKLKGLWATWKEVFEHQKLIAEYVERIPDFLRYLAPEASGESAGDEEPTFASDLNRFRTLLFSSPQEPFDRMGSIFCKMNNVFPYIFGIIHRKQDDQNNMQQQNEQRAIEGFNNALKITGSATLLVASFPLVIIGVLCWWRNRMTNKRLYMKKV